MKKDRFSIHVHNGDSKELEAVTILRHGGTASQSGLVGITNLTHSSSNPPILPETIFNVQSTGVSNIRLASSGRNQSNLELLGNGNARASGLHISYDPTLDGTPYLGPSGSVDFGATNQTVVDFSLIRPSGTVGREIGFLSVSENGLIGIGSTRDADRRLFNSITPLTVSHSSAASGTIALRSQSSTPASSTHFGQIYFTSQKVHRRTQPLLPVI